MLQGFPEHSWSTEFLTFQYFEKLMFISLLVCLCAFLKLDFKKTNEDHIKVFQVLKSDYSVNLGKIQFSVSIFSFMPIKYFICLCPPDS